MRADCVPSIGLSTFLRAIYGYGNAARRYSCYLALVYRQGADTPPQEARSYQHSIFRAFIPDSAKSPPGAQRCTVHK